MIPSVIRIGPIDFTVKTVDDLHDNHVKLDGHIRYASTSILLESALNPQAILLTLWHEITHGILVQSGHAAGIKDPVIDALAYGIIDVLRNNPWLRDPETNSEGDGND